MVKVIRDRKALEASGFYDKYYARANRVDILGISCGGFMKDLYPSYFPPRRGDGHPAKASTRIKDIAPKLRKALETGTNFKVRLMDPASPYVEARMSEAPDAEEKCRDNIVEVINALRCLTEDLRRSPLPIKGSVSIRTVKKNPYLSIFRAMPGPLCIGFITPDGLGNRQPMLSITGEEPDLFEMSTKHLRDLDRGSEPLFTWKGKTPEFKGGMAEDHHDVFLSYNHKDLEAVEEIEAGLMWHGIRGWSDKRIMGGADFWKEIVKVAGNVKCAAVFFGPDGLGTFQQQNELPVLLSLLKGRGLTVIPVLLKGAPAAPKWPHGLIDQITRINFGESKSDPLAELVSAIKGANASF